MGNSIRRKISAELKALEMDEDRKVLFVEGSDDRLFFKYLCGNNINDNTLIKEINCIEIQEEVENGNRGRIIHFATKASGKFVDRLRFFIDKDYSEFINEKLPNNVTTTDFKDLESYLYERKSLDKFLNLGVKTDKIDSKKLLEVIYEAKYFGFVRLHSIANKLCLKVNKTNENIRKHLTLGSDFSLSINGPKYLNAVFQNTNDKTLNFAELEAGIKETISLYEHESSRNLVHGKDALSLIAEVCNKLGLKKDSVASVFWMCFEANNVKNYPNLKSVVTFLELKVTT